MWQRGRGHPGGAHDIDVEDAPPLVVVVGGCVALGTDAGVVDDDVQLAEVGGHLVDGARHLRPVTDVAGHEEVLAGRGLPVQDRDPRSAGGQQVGRSGTDAAGSAGDNGYQSVELAHEVIRGSMWIFGPVPASSGRQPPSTSAVRSRPTVAATSGRGSTRPVAYCSIVPSIRGEPLRMPTAVTSLRTAVRVSIRLGSLASPTSTSRPPGSTRSRAEAGTETPLVASMTESHVRAGSSSETQVPRAPSERARSR